MNEYLPLLTLWRLLAVLALTLLPHMARLPVWASLFIAGLIVWRGLAAYRQWRMPPPWLKFVVTALAFAGVMASFGRVSGQNAGTALLCVMAALKLLEFKGRRDVMIVVFLMYFMLVTHFLYSQELWTVAYLLVCVTAITALLVECQHRGALSPRLTLRKGGVMVLQALPLMALLFVLFPRIPGPLWGLPADAGAARSGLSDRMSPGDISSLIQSAEIAFRVEFFDPPPAPAQRYWRGPVFDSFDGRSWEEALPTLVPGYAPALQLGGAPIRYALTLEPHRARWLLALEMPAAATLPDDAFLGREGTLLARKNVIERRRYTLSSHPQFSLAADLAPRSQARYLRLPAGYNPRTAALAQRLRDAAATPADIVSAALRLFREQPFVYTLQPPALGRDSVDDFLFATRRGFCEHYASAFTVLMRAAGIPARVVTGYQGGQLNEIGGYFVVRQSDAHAWSEVWLDGRGWVRVDPTAAVAPERIERSIEAALADRELLPSHLSARTRLRFYVEARWDWLNAQWNGWVLAYGPELQQEFLRRFGIGDLRGMILALTLLGTAMLAVLGGILLRQAAPARTRDRVLREWQRLSRRLARTGVAQRRDEGPRDYITRVRAQRPDLAAPLEDALAAYLSARYQVGDPRNSLEQLVAIRRRVRV